MEEHSIQEDELRDPVDEPEPTFEDLGADIDGDALLDSVHNSFSCGLFPTRRGMLPSLMPCGAVHCHLDGYLGQLAANCFHVAGARIWQNARTRGDGALGAAAVALGQ